MTSAVEDQGNVEKLVSKAGSDSGKGLGPMEGATMSSTKGMEMERSMSMDQSQGGNNNDNSNNINNNSGDYGKSLPPSSHSHHQPTGGRPPHPPYNKHNGSYSSSAGHYSGYPPAPTGPPTRQLHSVVTSSFSAEDSGDHSHRGSHPPVPRHVSVNPGSQRPWGRPPNDEHYTRESGPDNQERDQPPRGDSGMTGMPPIVPPSPSHGGAQQGRYTNGGPYSMVPPEPLKRNFWHHSRPSDEYNSSSVPPEFIPPKRTKLTPPPPINTRPVMSPTGADMRDLRRPPSFFNRDLSWESREDSSYYHGARGTSRESPRYHSEQGPSYHQHMGSPSHSQQYHHSSPSPTSQYRDDQRGPHHHNSHQYPPPPQEISYHHPHHGSPSHGGNHHHNRRWSHNDGWQPSPTSGPRRSPTSYHQPPSMGHPPQFRDDVESNRGWTPPMERESMSPEDSRRMNHYDPRREHESAYHHNSPHYNPYGQYNKKPHHHGGPPPLPPPHMSGSHGGMPPLDQRNHPDSRSRMMNDGARVGPEGVGPMCHPIGDAKNGKDGPILVLALPQDRISLSETLCVVRENIEVFKATKSDVEAPAPGRKHAVVVDQVGLRCIHCRHTTRSSERVKRAVCYPSSIKRIYRTVIDMKLDHFVQCKFVPDALKDRLAELKVKHTRSTGTTMQYFIRAAHALGMEDAASGVRLNDNRKHSLADMPPLVSADCRGVARGAPVPPPAPIPENKPVDGNIKQESPEAPGSIGSDYQAIRRMDSVSSESTNMTPDTMVGDSETFYNGKIILALPEDKMALSPLRCFLRSQVCAFSATNEDIAVRAPTTFSIKVGQVGIGCIHCVNQPSKDRSNRAVCFPFSIARIYQSVADIQRFHFGECKMLPPEVKEKFLSLQRASSKGSKGLATRQYWVTSARKLGLVDTPQGIRFGRDPTKKEQSAMSLDILAQVAFNVTTASRELVLPEDKPYIAEFLYVVMEQLQPCRFTEADRNKRRLKDVGCIGVECKHCAGQVDGRKFFWSSVNAVESNFVSVHTHMMECRMVPKELKEKLAELKLLRKEQTAALKTGSQKAFFSRVWARLHGEDRKGQKKAAARQKQQQQSQDGKNITEEEEETVSSKEELPKIKEEEVDDDQEMSTDDQQPPQLPGSPLHSSHDENSSQGDGGDGCPSPMASDTADTVSEPENSATGVVEGVSNQMCQMSVVGV